MDKEQDEIASGEQGHAAACGPSPGPGCSAFDPGRLLHKQITGADNLWEELDAEEREIWSRDEAELFADMTSILRERFANEMLLRGYATGHGDTLEELHRELFDQLDNSLTGQLEKENPSFQGTPHETTKGN